MYDLSNVIEPELVPDNCTTSIAEPSIRVETFDDVPAIILKMALLVS